MNETTNTHAEKNVLTLAKLIEVKKRFDAEHEDDPSYSTIGFMRASQETIDFMAKKLCISKLDLPEAQFSKFMGIDIWPWRIMPFGWVALYDTKGYPVSMSNIAEPKPNLVQRFIKALRAERGRTKTK